MYGSCYHALNVLGQAVERGRLGERRGSLCAGLTPFPAFSRVQLTRRDRQTWSDERAGQRETWSWSTLNPHIYLLAIIIR